MGANEKREGGDGGIGYVRARQRRARAAQGQQRQEHDAASRPSERTCERVIERECASESSSTEGQSQALDDIGELQSSLGRICKGLRRSCL